MSPPVAFIKMLLFWTLVPAVTLVAVTYLWLAMIGLAWTPYTCITEVRERISGVSGFDFEISETDCDTLAKDASISVFVSKPGRAKKTLLLQYGPTGVDDIPVITPVDQHTVQISIREISDLMFRRDTLKDLSVKYRIDVIDYPTKAVEKNE